MYRKHNGVHLSQFSDKFFSLCLFQLGNASHRFWTQDGASSVTFDLITSVGSYSFHQLFQSTSVFLVNLREGSSGAWLPVSQMSQPGLLRDGAVGGSHLATQSRQEDSQLMGSTSRVITTS